MEYRKEIQESVFKKMNMGSYLMNLNSTDVFLEEGSGEVKLRHILNDDVYVVIHFSNNNMFEPISSVQTNMG